jgi:aerobic carbon-monoxide dehydrogenase medium subunit
MKPAPFDYARAASLAEATRLLQEGGTDARPIAGGQSLGPMLNLRLAQPKLLVDVSGIPELGGAAERADAVVIGAAVTHAAIEDRRIPDIGQNVLARIASGIAYRAVRNRGTVGGSLSHADPAADWLTALTALGATIVVHGAGGERTLSLPQFIAGPFATVIAPGEIVRVVEIPKLSAGARWGWYKVCRKPGEFASTIAAVLIDAARGIRRAVIGATGDKPIVLEGETVSEDALASRLAAIDPLERRVHLVALRRALAQVSA